MFVRGEKFPFIARYYLKTENKKQNEAMQKIIRNLKEQFTKKMDGIMRSL